MQMMHANANAACCQLQEHTVVFSMGKTKKEAPATHSTVENTSAASSILLGVDISLRFVVEYWKIAEDRSA